MTHGHTSTTFSFMRLIGLALLLFIDTRSVFADNVDTAVTGMADRMAKALVAKGKPKLAVLDFTDIEGRPTEFGRFLAEQLSVEFVNTSGISVVDRANLRSLLAEHKLSETGLVNPAAAKQLGQFAGVDVVIIGTVAPLDDGVAITVKAISTQTAEIVAASKATVSRSRAIEKLLSAPTSNLRAAEGNSMPNNLVGKTRTFGPLRVDLESLRIVNGKEYLLTVTLTNVGQTLPLVAAIHGQGVAIKTKIRDPEGYEFEAREHDADGIQVGYLLAYLGYQGTSKTLNPGESVTGTIKYHTLEGRRAATPGTCKVQLEAVVLRINGEGRIVAETTCNLLTDIEAQ